MIIEVEKNKSDTFTYDEEKQIKCIFRKLDEALKDVEQGRIQTIDEAWVEIDAV